MGFSRLLKPFAAVGGAAALLAQPAFAHCPLCAAATAGGVAATRLLGVDDAVVGTFVGGFVASTGLWFDTWLRKKTGGKELLPFQTAILILLSLSFTFLTFYLSKLLGSKDQAYLMLGVDKLLIGTLAGAIVTLGAFALHKWIRKVNDGRSLMPFQGILVTLVSLIAAAAVFFFIT